MEFEDKQTSRPAEPAPSAGSNSDFLQSMGFGEEDLHDLEPESDKGSDDEVALSSLPDDLEMPGAEAKSSNGPRVVGVQIGNTSHQVEEDGRIDLSGSRSSQQNEHRDASEDSENEESSSEMNDPNLLYLHCPSCDEELVLRKEHVGVEGACVWCDTKIVAARSGLEGEVKVFALEAPKTLVPKEETLAEEPSEDEVSSEELPSEEAVSDQAASEEVGVEAREETRGEEGEESLTSGAAETREEEPSSSWAMPAEAVDPEDSEKPEPVPTEDPATAFSGWSGMAPLEAEKEEKEDPSNEVPKGFNEALPEREDPAPPSAAEEPSSDFAAPPSPWGESLDSSDAPEEKKPLSDSEVSPDSPDSGQESPEPIGFGDLDFAPDLKDSGPAEDAAMPEGFAPSPFSGDTPPAEEPGFLPEEPEEAEGVSSEAASVEESESKDALEVLFGSSPEEASVPENADDPDASPKAIGGFESPSPPPMEATPSSWEGSIGSGESPSIELGPLPAPEEPFASAKADTDQGVSGNEAEQGLFEAPAGFFMPDPSELADAAPEPVKTSSPESDFEAGFASPAPLGDAEPPADGFQIPASEPHDFAMDSSAGPVEEPAPFPSSAPEGTAVAMSPAEAPAMPTESGISAPESPFFSGEVVEPTPAGDFSASAPAESLFSESSDPDSSPSPFKEAMSESPVAESAASPFEEARSEAPAAPPALPASEPAAAPAVFSEEAPSSETSAREKTKKIKAKGPRKGLVVMLVVLIGFVCGAALASFVLPVDQYVLKARNYMEEKFNPGGAVLNQDLLPSRDPSSVSVGNS